MSAVVTGPFYVIDVFCSNNTVRVHFFQVEKREREDEEKKRAKKLAKKC